MTRRPIRDYDAYDRERRRNIYNGNPEPDHFDNRRQPYNDYDRGSRGQDEYDEYLAPVGNRNTDYGGWYEDADYNNTYYGGDCGNNYGNNRRDLSADEYSNERRYVDGRREGEYDEDRRYTAYEADRTGGLHPGQQRTRYWDEENGYRSAISGNRGHSGGAYYSNSQPRSYDRGKDQNRNRNDDTRRERTSDGRGDRGDNRQSNNDFNPRRNQNAGNGRDQASYNRDGRRDVRRSNNDLAPRRIPNDYRPSNNQDFDQQRNVADRNRNADSDRGRANGNRRNGFWAGSRDQQNTNPARRDYPRRDENMW